MSNLKKIEEYTLHNLIGKGSFGEVYYTQKDKSSIPFATKIIRKELADSKQYFKYFANEIMFLQNITHENIIKMDSFKKTLHHYYIVMEYCNGGTVKDNYKKYLAKYGKPFSEKIIQHIIRQIVKVVSFLHSKNIVHRDLKLENMLLNYHSKEAKDNLDILHSDLKLIDFGTIAYKNKSEDNSNLFETIIGSPFNMDPLILQMYTGASKDVLPYDEKIDIWSLGVICYYLFAGEVPFQANNAYELLNEIEKGIIKIPIKISIEAISFLLKMFQYYPDKRINAEELLKHPFIQSYSGDFSYLDLKNPNIANCVKNGFLYVNIKNNDAINSIINQYMIKNIYSKKSFQSNSDSSTDITPVSNNSSSEIGGSAPLGKIKNISLEKPLNYKNINNNIISSKNVGTKPITNQQNINITVPKKNINNPPQTFIYSSPSNNIYGNNPVEQKNMTKYQIGNSIGQNINKQKNNNEKIITFTNQGVYDNLNTNNSSQNNMFGTYQPNNINQFNVSFNNNINTNTFNGKINNVKSSLPIKGVNNLANYK